VEGGVAAADLPRWRRGVELADGPARPLTVELLESGRASSRLALVFAEGRKHEVKRYCEALGHRVVRLVRTGFGPLRLQGLATGAWRALTPREVRALRAAVASGPPPAR
jgi:23S rRNA pseudouridine2605 synthase